MYIDQERLRRADYRKGDLDAIYAKYGIEADKRLKVPLLDVLNTFDLSTALLCLKAVPGCSNAQMQMSLRAIAIASPSFKSTRTEEAFRQLSAFYLYGNPRLDIDAIQSHSSAGLSEVANYLVEPDVSDWVKYKDIDVIRTRHYSPASAVSSIFTSSVYSIYRKMRLCTEIDHTTEFLDIELRARLTHLCQSYPPY